LTGNLIELLSAMRADGRSLIALAEFSDCRYVQFFVDAEGDVMAEVISNLNIGEAIALEPEDEDALRALGFSEPSYERIPNWWIHALTTEDFTAMASTINAAICTVLRESPSNEVTVSTWPASGSAEMTADDRRATFRVHVAEGTGDRLDN
jgi:hypothetical protein